MTSPFASGPFDWGPIVQAAHRGDLDLVQFGSTPADVARHAKRPVYLSTPYSREVVNAHGDWMHGKSTALMLDAGLQIGRLKEAGVTAISPIVLSATVVHAASHNSDHMKRHNPLDATAWMQWCNPLMHVCGAIVVPDLPGWWRSEGIKAEVQYFITRMLPVFIYATGFEIEF